MEETLSEDSASPEHRSPFPTALAKSRGTETQSKKLTELWPDRETNDDPMKSPRNDEGSAAC